MKETKTDWFQELINRDMVLNEKSPIGRIQRFANLVNHTENTRQELYKQFFDNYGTKKNTPRANTKGQKQKTNWKKH